MSPIEPPVWRVLTWNLHGSADPDLRAISQVLASYEADVVTLQEVRRHQARRIAQTLGWTHRWARKHHPYSPLVWWRTEGHALLTPHALDRTSATSISSGASTWTYRHRIVLSGTVRRGRDPLRVHDTHLASDDPDARIAQAARVADRVIADRSPVQVVAGDLNLVDAGGPGGNGTGDAVEVLRELRRAGLADPGSPSTSPATVPHQRLDRILIPADATLVDQHVPEGGDQWSELSDHLPLFTAFRIAT